MHPEIKESLKLSDKGSYYKQDDETLLDDFVFNFFLIYIIKASYTTKFNLPNNHTIVVNKLHNK
jgi:hypothetical protein